MTSTEVIASPAPLESLTRDTSSSHIPPASPHAPPVWKAVAAKVTLGYLVMSALLIGIGLLIVHPLAGSGLVHWDESTVRWFAAHRTPHQNSVTMVWSKLADAPGIVAVGLVVGAALAVGRHWRQIAYLAAILAVELGTFLTISYAVHRTRPEVVHLGSVPSTGSFPSGHIAATIVLYGFVTVLLYRFAAPLPAPLFAGVWTVLAALAVGWSRMYRGMHHPLDVIAGAVMGVGVLLVFIWAVGPARGDSRRDSREESS